MKVNVHKHQKGFSKMLCFVLYIYAVKVTALQNNVLG